MSLNCRCILSDKDPLCGWHCFATKCYSAALLIVVSLLIMDGLTWWPLMTSLTKMMSLFLIMMMMMLVMVMIPFAMFMLVPTICKRYNIIETILLILMLLVSLFVCLFVTEVTQFCVSTGSFQDGSLVNTLQMCQLHMMENIAGINSLQWYLLWPWDIQQLIHFWIPKEPDELRDWPLKGLLMLLLMVSFF